MLPTWKTLLRRNLLLIAAIESINLPKAGCGMFDLSYISDAKLRMTFNIYDCDGDGFISRKDYVGMIEKFADKENFDPSQKEAARKSFSDLFSFYISAAGGKDVPLTVNLLIESMKMQKDNPEFKKNVEAAMLSLITPMKLQEAGYLNYNEFNRGFENFDFFNVFFTKGAFGLMDANRDGKVSVAELSDAKVAFMTTDENLATSLFGFLG